MAGISKASASRALRAYNLSWTGTGTLVSTPIGPSIQHVRILSQIGGIVTVDNLGTLPTTAGTVGTLIAANTANGDYFSCVPGEVVAFSSTSTSSGTVNVTECA